MRAEMKLLPLAAAVGALTACHGNKGQPQDQNISIDEGPMSNGIPANADVETLPPDESSTTPSNELANGSDNPDVADSNAE